MNSLKNAGHAISEKTQEVAHGGSYQANKTVAKDRNAPIGTRLSAAKDAVGDKAKEQHHGAKGRSHRELI
ncbi:glucose-repressible protein-like protein [Emericellopsis cladophorae]|uniref:Glucose-repressible protein-like protein n=1 Tax=Emericellopsis cladophorae TaxID=2686198 RepID=A0A9P9Y2I0_9HYPO|nr:glucose-repressible protein-like protein [Emericellopsis cladophorae]KAI6781953.1 glucose-repressible protein-like protein [Emericellopsis cladophorae]